ncbi:nematode cuticle collagen domain protein, partial [Teladorsagia circumcincta]
MATTSLVTLGAIVIVGCIFNDINQFYDTSMANIVEFKFYADDAWQNMVHSDQQSYYGLQELLERFKRENQDCNCAPRAEKCPVGPQGPPGEEGIPGENG